MSPTVGDHAGRCLARTGATIELSLRSHGRIRRTGGDMVLWHCFWVVARLGQRIGTNCSEDLDR